MDEATNHFEFDLPATDQTDEEKVKEDVERLNDDDAREIHEGTVAEIRSKTLRALKELCKKSLVNPFFYGHHNQYGGQALVEAATSIVMESGDDELIAKFTDALRRVQNPPTFSDGDYPLRADAPDHYDYVRKNVASIFERARDRHGKRTWTALAGDFGFSDSKLRGYRRNPETMPAARVIQLGDFAGMTVEEMRSVARGRKGAEDIVPRLTATFEYIASCDELEPEYVAILYQHVDDDTKAVITHAIKAWARFRQLEDE